MFLKCSCPLFLSKCPKCSVLSNCLLPHICCNSNPLIPCCSSRHPAEWSEAPNFGLFIQLIPFDNNSLFNLLLFFFTLHSELLLNLFGKLLLDRCSCKSKLTFFWSTPDKRKAYQGKECRAPSSGSRCILACGCSSLPLRSSNSASHMWLCLSGWSTVEKYMK